MQRRFGRCLRAGLTESPWVPHAQTATIMRQMDELRAAWADIEAARATLGWSPSTTLETGLWALLEHVVLELRAER